MFPVLKRALHKISVYWYLYLYRSVNWAYKSSFVMYTSRLLWKEINSWLFYKDLLKWTTQKCWQIIDYRDISDIDYYNIISITGVLNLIINLNAANNVLCSLEFGYTTQTIEKKKNDRKR